MAIEKTILITGANGQLGKEFRALAVLFPQYNFLFTGREELPIENLDVVKKYFTAHSINFCINCAAYTAVDKAETEKETAFLINATAVANLATVCAQFKIQLIHLSTDYVFNGTNTQPYKETDFACHIGIYGLSKLKGEELAVQNNPAVIIVRTSWVYSSFGNNFVKTMLRLMQEKKSINVVDDQFGCPTYAADLANAIMVIIERKAKIKIQNSKWVSTDQIFHYCNNGVISWYQFASAIKELTGSTCMLYPVPTSQYPTLAKRPQYSVLDTAKIKDSFKITIPQWKDSLKKCLALMN